MCEACVAMHVCLHSARSPACGSPISSRLGSKRTPPSTLAGCFSYCLAVVHTCMQVRNFRHALAIMLEVRPTAQRSDAGVWRRMPCTAQRSTAASRGLSAPSAPLGERPAGSAPMV